jgi:hypothetical protein
MQAPKSKFYSVSWNSTRGWRASGRKTGRHLGYFGEQEHLAARAVDDARRIAGDHRDAPHYNFDEHGQPAWDNAAHPRVSNAPGVLWDASSWRWRVRNESAGVAGEGEGVHHFFRLADALASRSAYVAARAATRAAALAAAAAARAEAEALAQEVAEAEAEAAAAAALTLALGDGLGLGGFVSPTAAAAAAVMANLRAAP